MLVGEFQEGGQVLQISIIDTASNAEVVSIKRRQKEGSLIC